MGCGILALLAAAAIVGAFRWQAGHAIKNPVREAASANTPQSGGTEAGGQKTAPNLNSSLPALTVTLAESNTAVGLFVPSEGDGVNQPEIIEGITARRIISSCLYIAINHPDYGKGPVDLDVEVEVYDDGPAHAARELILQYDKASPTPDQDTKYTPADGGMLLSGKGQWERTVFHLPETRLGHGQNANADFRILGPGAAIHRISVGPHQSTAIRLPEPQTGIVGTSGGQKRPDRVWMGPSPARNGTNFQQLFLKASDWSETRKLIDVLAYPDGHFDRSSDDELRDAFAKLRQWNIKFALEVGAVKPWAKDGADAFRARTLYWDRCLTLGAPLHALAMDEPLHCTRHDLKLPDSHAIEQTTRFMAEARAKYPDVLIGDIEPYPYFKYEELTNWVARLQANCESRGIRGLDFVRLDPDWYGFPYYKRGSWGEIREFERFCHDHGMRFSLIYWASDWAKYKNSPSAAKTFWYTSIMYQGKAYESVGGAPDQFVIQSWIDAPPECLPDSSNYSFTGSVRAFCQGFVRPLH